MFEINTTCCQFVYRFLVGTYHFAQVMYFMGSIKTVLLSISHKIIRYWLHWLEHTMNLVSSHYRCSPLIHPGCQCQWHLPLCLYNSSVVVFLASYLPCCQSHFLQPLTHWLISILLTIFTYDHSEFPTAPETFVGQLSLLALAMMQIIPFCCSYPHPFLFEIHSMYGSSIYAQPLFVIRTHWG